jgi:hypothetical protein
VSAEDFAGVFAGEDEDGLAGAVVADPEVGKSACPALGEFA